MVLRLTNQQKAYDWGDPDAIPRFLGSEPDGSPVAELWMGAHPAGSSTVLQHDGRPVSLHDLISTRPADMLGPVAAQGVRELPFLFKLLAASRALSIQVHPSREQAAKGFAREEARGVPIDAAERTYKDRNHKPELMYAAGPFWAMSGFRDPDDSASLLSSAGIPVNDTRAVLETVLSMSETDVEAACASLLLPDADPERVYGSRGAVDDQVRLAWVRNLREQYGNDPGILAPLFLNVVRLEAGDALYQGAGLVHAYLRGFGFEIMANCDNVLRAGLTSKYMDVDELLSIVDFTPAAPRLVNPGTPVSGVREFACEVPDFRLLEARPVSGVSTVDLSGCPAIVLCTAGAVTIEPGGVRLSRGESAFVAGSTGAFSLEPVSHTGEVRALIASCSASVV